MVVYIIISLFAFYGFFHLLRDIAVKIKTGCRQEGGKLCLVPQPGDEKLEGRIRCIFLEEIPEKLGTDSYLYIRIEENDPNKHLLERLASEYPRLVLLDSLNWSRISSRERQLGS